MTLIFWIFIIFIIITWGTLMKIPSHILFAIRMASFVTFLLFSFSFWAIIEFIFSDRVDPVVDKKVDTLWTQIWIVWWLFLTVGISLYFKNIFSKKISFNRDTKFSVDTTVTLNEKIGLLDIGWYNTVIFLFAVSPAVKVVSKNLAKVAYSIIHDFKKNTFHPLELKNHFEYIRNQYQSRLSQQDYNKIIMLCEKFSDEWGKLEISIT